MKIPNACSFSIVANKFVPLIFFVVIAAPIRVYWLFYLFEAAITTSFRFHCIEGKKYTLQYGSGMDYRRQETATTKMDGIGKTVWLETADASI